MDTYTGYGNLFENIPDAVPDEIFDTIFQDNNLKIERIVSNGNCTAKGQWLEQDTYEWVILIKGGAKLLFRDTQQVFTLSPGDYIFIEAHCLHRIEWTDHRQKTVWVAVHGQKRIKD